MNQDEIKVATKYILIVVGGIMTLGLSAFAVLPYNYSIIRPESELAYAIIFYYPFYGMVAICTATAFWVRSDMKKKKPAEQK